MAVTDPQKANLLANTIKNNFIENNRMQDNYDQDDEVVTSAVNTFLSSPLLLKLNLSCLMKLLTSLKILALKRPRKTKRKGRHMSMTAKPIFQPSAASRRNEERKRFL
ncbi:hypothetical protein TNCV_1667611 [Trichonephila clavipes]|nr:hypothetical protein TNCV_1667611 [Trichonephila clavipes]